MNRLILFAAVLILAPATWAQTCHYRAHGPAVLPDPTCTPGVDNPAVTQATIKQTICKSGWTKTVRPDESVTNKIKAASMVAYGDTVPQVPPLPVIIKTKIVKGKKVTTRTVDVSKCVDHSNDGQCYEGDHDESIEDGGSPDDPLNIWAQPYKGFGARKKDVVETWLKTQVCSGKMDVSEARMMLRTDWYAAYLYMQKMKQKAKGGKE